MGRPRAVPVTIVADVQSAGAGSPRRSQQGEETAEALLAAVPEISTTSARVLLGLFGSVAAVVATGPAEWLEVPGIGPERARALEETFRLRVSASPRTGEDDAYARPTMVREGR